MLASITPLGERGRRSRWSVTATAYVVGSVVAGAAFGLVLGLLGALLPRRDSHPVAYVVLAAAAAGVGILLDLRVLGLRLPTVHRQVDEDWLQRYRGWVYGGGFGLQLGLGVVTIVTTSTVYTTLLLALLAGTWWAGLAVGGAFGLVRALPLLTVRRAVTFDRLAAAHRRMQRWAPRANRSALLAHGLVLGLSAVVSLGALV